MKLDSEYANTLDLIEDLAAYLPWGPKDTLDMAWVVHNSRPTELVFLKTDKDIMSMFDTNKAFKNMIKLYVALVKVGVPLSGRSGRKKERLEKKK